MTKDKSKELFEAWWEVHGSETSGCDKDMIWKAWEASRRITQIYTKA